MCRPPQKRESPIVRPDSITARWLERLVVSRQGVESGHHRTLTTGTAIPVQRPLIYRSKELHHRVIRPGPLLRRAPAARCAAQLLIAELGLVGGSTGVLSEGLLTFAIPKDVETGVAGYVVEP